MKEAAVDLWDLCGRVEVMCITTNGTIKQNGRAVMGRGCALEAKTRFRDIDLWLGGLLRAHGNIPLFLGLVDIYKVWTRYEVRTPLREASTSHLSELWSFPVKHTWNQRADLELIRWSAHLLREQMGDRDVEVVIPRPGCGNGGLEWGSVRAALSTLLDERFTFIDRAPVSPQVVG